MIELTNDAIKLFWEGPFTVKDQRIYQEDLPGVYLFSTQTKNYFSITYIGKTEMPIKNRLVGYQSGSILVPGHFRDMISGRYWLYDIDDIKKEKITALYKGGDFFEFYSNLDKYMQVAQRAIEDTACFMCTFNNNSELINYTEKLLIYHAFNNADSFPILDNSMKTANNIFQEEVKGLSLHNTVPANITLKGLSERIEYPD